jgi:hypothetical protein
MTYAITIAHERTQPRCLLLKQREAGLLCFSISISDRLPWHKVDIALLQHYGENTGDKGGRFHCPVKERPNSGRRLSVDL